MQHPRCDIEFEIKKFLHMISFAFSENFIGFKKMHSLDKKLKNVQLLFEMDFFFFENTLNNAPGQFDPVCWHGLRICTEILSMIDFAEASILKNHLNVNLRFEIILRMK